MRNKFYNRKCFCLIKVKFSIRSGELYTYACHKSLKVAKGDMVTVPTNTEEFNSDYDRGHEFLKVARVTAVTNDLRHISDDYDLKHVVSKVDTQLHDKILRAKLKSNARSRRTRKRK